MKNKIFYNEFWECRANLILNFALREDDFNSVSVIACYSWTGFKHREPGSCSSKFEFTTSLSTSLFRIIFQRFAQLTPNLPSPFFRVAQDLRNTVFWSAVSHARETNVTNSTEIYFVLWYFGTEMPSDIVTSFPPYFCRGEVVKGFGRGSKELGIPTGELRL